MYIICPNQNRKYKLRIKDCFHKLHGFEELSYFSMLGEDVVHYVMKAASNALVIFYSKSLFCYILDQQ